VWRLNIPAPRTIRAHLQNFECNPGIIPEVLEALRIKSRTMDDYSKICGIAFDEMSLDSRYLLDKSQDMIISHGKAQAVMIRGLVSNWKQPIFYEFDTPMTKGILLDLVIKMEAIGFKVHSTTSDFGADNQSLWKSMGIDDHSTSFCNPADNSRRVHVFADVPHMLKLIRNHLIDDGLQTFSGTTINLETIQTLILANGNEMRLCPHLTHNLIQLTKAERMRVQF